MNNNLLLKLKTFCLFRKNIEKKLIIEKKDIMPRLFEDFIDS